MQPVKNERGYALVFVTLMIVLLLVMVGMGLDTGHLAYVRSQGQPAVDAAALAAASAIPSGNWSRVTERAAMLNPGGTNPGTGNNYLDSPNNQIDHKNVTLVKYDNATGEFTTSGVNINNANGARVALENNNPYGGNAGEAMKSPLFLTPLLNLFGQATKTTADVSVSAVAVNQALPGLPIVVVQGLCGQADTILDFQSGGNSTAGWETYQIINASTDEVRGLFEKLPFVVITPEVVICLNIFRVTLQNQLEIASITLVIQEHITAECSHPIRFDVRWVKPNCLRSQSFALLEIPLPKSNCRSHMESARIARSNLLKQFCFLLSLVPPVKSHCDVDESQARQYIASLMLQQFFKQGSSSFEFSAIQSSLGRLSQIVDAGLSRLRHSLRKKPVCLSSAENQAPDQQSSSQDNQLLPIDRHIPPQDNLHLRTG